MNSRGDAPITGRVVDGKLIVTATGRWTDDDFEAVLADFGVVDAVLEWEYTILSDTHTEVWIFDIEHVRGFDW